jgi:alpha-1,2-mannosyltransferase
MFARLTTLTDRLGALIAARPLVWRVGVGVTLAVVLAVTVGLYLHKIDKKDRNEQHTKSAFLRWRPQIEDLDRGVDIYDAHNYPNPPIMALILRPFVALPPFTGAVVWLLVKAALAGVLFVWAVRLASEPGGRFPPLAAFAVGVLSIHPILGDLQHGNVNIFIAFLVFASLELFRRGWDVSAGVVLALAIACKVTPALFVVYFGWKVLHGRWTAPGPVLRAMWKSGGGVLLGTLLGLVLWLIVVPGAVLGFERNNALLKSWYGMMVKPFVEKGTVTTEHPNQSIPGLVFRLLTDSPSDIIYDDDGKPVPVNPRNVVDAGPDAAKWVVRGCQGAFAVALLLLAGAPIASRRQGVWFAAECGFILLGMLLFSERTWKHHATTTALPMAALVGCWVFGGIRGRMRAYLLGTLTVATLLMTVPSLLPEDPNGYDPQDDCLVYGTHTAAFVLLSVALAVVMWKAAGNSRATDSTDRTDRN